MTAGLTAMSLQTLLKTQALKTVYQPIVDTYRSSLIGYESLIRGPQNYRLARPDALFAEADELGLRQDLEHYCMRAAVSDFDTVRFSGALFVNIDPNLLSDPAFIDELAVLHTSTAANIVLELSEQHPVEDVPELQRQVHRLRAMGYRFAIDDLGAGHSSFKLWAEIRPDFVKLDRYFISDIDKSPYKREFVQHIVTLAKNLHATVIAEGIETKGELRQLQKMGIYAMQGFLLARPASEPYPVELLSDILSQGASVERYDALRGLIEETTVVTSERKITDVLDYFRQNKRLVTIPVINNQEVVGIIRRGQFMELMSTAFGRALFANKPAHSVMQTNYLVIDVQAPLEQASALLTEHEDTIEQQVLLIVDKGLYAGIIPVPSLLRRITELKIQNARYANPLTLLPGNVPINQAIDRCVSECLPFTVLYFDLNYFKPFNDEYGYHRGDAVLQWFAHLLEANYSPDGHFLGHVGGDDFILVSQNTSYDAATLSRVKQVFHEEIRSFYKAQHLENNCMLGRARDGSTQKFPLLDFSVAVVSVPARTSMCHQEIASAAAALKSQAKRAEDGIAYCDLAESASRPAGFA